MSDEITSAISESIADLPGSDADTTVDTTTDASASAAPSATVGDPAADPVDGDAPPPETDPTTGQPVQKPLSRSQKRIQQLLETNKAAEAKWQEEVNARETRLKELEWAQAPDAVHLLNGLRLMNTDPKTFIENVLLKDERYQGLIAMKQAEQAAAAEQAAQPPAFPAADMVYDDGSPAHSPEVIAKHMQDVATFVARQVTQAEAQKWDARVKELESLVKPIAQERYDTATYNTKLAENKSALDEVVQVYGPLATEKQGEMHTWLKGQWAQGKRAGLSDAVKAVLVPAMRKALEEARKGQLSAADNTHAQRIAAANTDAAAAERAAAAGARSVSGSGDEIEDAIRGAIAGLPR
jgi:hypothetical protein